MANLISLVVILWIVLVHLWLLLVLESVNQHISAKFLAPLLVIYKPIIVSCPASHHLRENQLTCL